MSTALAFCVTRTMEGLSDSCIQEFLANFALTMQALVHLDINVIADFCKLSERFARQRMSKVSSGRQVEGNSKFNHGSVQRNVMVYYRSRHSQKSFLCFRITLSLPQSPTIKGWKLPDTVGVLVNASCGMLSTCRASSAYHRISWRNCWSFWQEISGSTIFSWPGFCAMAYGKIYRRR